MRSGEEMRSGVMRSGDVRVDRRSRVSSLWVAVMFAFVIIVFHVAGEVKEKSY